MYLNSPCPSCIQVVSGQGIDRHLLGLRLTAQEAGMEIPDFFKDEAYSRSSHYCLFTSQVGCVCLHKVYMYMYVHEFMHENSIGLSSTIMQSQI